MPKIPADKLPDSSLVFLSEGYEFIGKRNKRYASDIFETRLMLKKTVCITGEDAARLFYDTDLFKREGAMPDRVKKTLLGKGGVQGLDGKQHRHRKNMFMFLMSQGRIQQLAAITLEEWNKAAANWENKKEIVLFDEVNKILFKAVCRWSGVPLPEEEIEKRTSQLASLIDTPAKVGPKYWHGKKERTKSEKWISGLVKQVRKGKLDPPEETALYIFSNFRTPKGKLLDRKTAAVELLNILRPTVAIGRYIVFMAHTMLQNPQYLDKLRSGDQAFNEMFVQEVRRFYPFFPAVAAKAKKKVEWKGYTIPKGRRVLLDLYGTTHDERSWSQPDEFIPERYLTEKMNEYNFIPQGGGDHYKNHRCAGEWITIELMKTSLKFLTEAITYDVPEQDLSISLSQVPALPKSGFVISNVRKKE